MCLLGKAVGTGQDGATGQRRSAVFGLDPLQLASERSALIRCRLRDGEGSLDEGPLSGQAGFS